MNGNYLKSANRRFSRFRQYSGDSFYGSVVSSAYGIKDDIQRFMDSGNGFTSSIIDDTP
jgi:hypothetical protein